MFNAVFLVAVATNIATAARNMLTKREKLPFHCAFFAQFLHTMLLITYSLNSELFFGFFSLLTYGSLFSFNDLLIDDTPRSSSTMNALNSARLPPNESSAEDDLDDEGHTDEEQNKNENGANMGGGDGKSLLHTLVKQIQLLHETNSKLFRSLHETKGMYVGAIFIIF